MAQKAVCLNIRFIGCQIRKKMLQIAEKPISSDLRLINNGKNRTNGSGRVAFQGGEFATQTGERLRKNDILKTSY
jgi:hypothetical protein